jgi:DNA-binding NtrC family response regulator
MGTPATPSVLVIDDHRDIFLFCERLLGNGYTFRHCPSGRAAMADLQAGCPEAVLLDRDFSQAAPADLLGPREDVRNEGLHILRALRHQHPLLPVIMVTGQRDLATALAAADLGAQLLAWEDVEAQPDLLARRLEQALDDCDANSDRVVAPFRRLGIVAESPAFVRALCALSKSLPGRAPILLLGPTGSGKDTLAYAAHSLSGDPARPFVAANVAALNPNLIESELFGHAKGAFTTAFQAHAGKLRAAHGGTLFLNEVGDLPLEIQAKLLTVLERQEVVPVGEVRSYPADFRLVCATSRDLRRLVETGQFRRDLLHRIAWHTIDLPPLGARLEDIPALAHAFLRATPAGRSGSVLGFTREAMEYMATLPWTGNVRELRGALEAASSLARHTITVADVREVVRRLEKLTTPDPADRDPLVIAGGSGEQSGLEQERRKAEDIVFGERTLDDLLRVYYFHLKRVSGGRLAEAARRAGIAKATIYEWRKRFETKEDTQPGPDGDA